MEFEQLLEKAQQVYRENFPLETWFERALFFSWSCSIKDCTFCYMSTQDKKNQNEDDKAVRSKESLYAEAILCKHLNWKIGFLSGGINAYSFMDLKEILRVIDDIVGEKIYVNAGAIPKSFLEKYKPYIRGVVGSIETVDEELHEKVCPSKPMGPYIRMFKQNKELGLENAMTLILGLGETKDDFEKLKVFIEENSIRKIHMYALNPVEGTEFEGADSPSPEYQAWWIAKTRIAFPKIDIQMGVWKDKLDRIPLLLKAGANSISKFPATRYFGRPIAKKMEVEAEKSDRKFLGSMTELPDVDWDAEVDSLNVDDETREVVRKKLKQYLKKMR